MVVVSDLHLAPTASEVSTRAADELAELLNGFHEPGMLVIAGDGFEMLAAAPDIAGILDSHPQFTDAVKRFAEDQNHRVVLIPGNHDGQLGWDGEVGRRAPRTPRRDATWRSPATWPCVTGNGSQLVRVMHGHQFDQYNAFDDPRSPVDTPLGHHVVRQVLPKLASRDQPGSLLEGVRWCNGDPSAFLGSRLLYRMVAGMAVVAGGAVRGRAGAALPVLRAGRQAAAEPSRRAVAGLVRHPGRRASRSSPR